MKKTVKQFVEMMEIKAKLRSSPLFFNEEFNKKHDLLNEQLGFIMKSPEYQALKALIEPKEEKSDVGGWIKWEEGMAYVVDTVVEVKARNGVKWVLTNPDWKKRNLDTDIIAYRIVEEPKKETLENIAKEHDAKMGRVMFKGNPKKEEKQTLVEYFKERGEYMMSHNDIIIISEYLEREK